MYRDTFPISMRVFGYDGIDYDVEGSVVTEWFPIHVCDVMYPTIVSVVFTENTTINGDQPCRSDMIEWQNQYFEDYRGHLEWLVRSVLEAHTDCGS